MSTKTHKIAEELHAALRVYAAQAGRTLKSVTEEMIQDGLQKRGVEIDGKAKNGDRDRENDTDNEGV